MKRCEPCSRYRAAAKAARAERLARLEGTPPHAAWTEFGTGFRMCSHCGARELPGGLVQGVPCDRCPIRDGKRATKLDVACAVAAVDALDAMDGYCLSCGCNLHNGCDCEPECPPHDDEEDELAAALAFEADDELVVGLVACSSAKASTCSPVPARDLYTSPLFRLARSYVERTCETWAILSARHGLVLPETPLLPYEQSLHRMKKLEREAWAGRVELELRERWPWARFVVIAGEHYRAALRGREIEVPLAGMGIGEQLGWLSREAALAGARS